jgi:hypothetical protein
LTPTVVDKNNIAGTVIRDGYRKMETSAAPSRATGGRRLKARRLSNPSSHPPKLSAVAR